MNDTDADRIAKALESIADSLTKLANPLVKVGEKSEVTTDYGTPFFPFLRKTIELPRKP